MPPDEQEFFQRVEALADRDGRYRRDAYLFVLGALSHTYDHVVKDQRHVTGPELLMGISDYALDQFGPMTKTVFDHWCVTETQDFGEIVFAMVEAGLMGKTDEDSIDDFKDVYDFDEEFDWRKGIARDFRPTDEE
ncbi:MAG: hypothetical protein QGH20_07885 [Candidatus Latescibacteria bacterium]|nr:hypothetical protein [Candidatus Latescibacterota bacterium]